ncbi:MAG: nickel pincer cofactor biosynthesis protein LarC [Myxococcota bacterium]|nr:nickel pincer cofactor biosynthesis protein LarC [Myxococcota bacterium]
MSRVLWIDASGGLAGDMLCGALLDAGASFDRAKRTVASLGLGASLRCETVHRGAFVASHFQVDCEHPPTDHRHYSDIVELLRKAPLSAATQERSLSVFRRIAEVEAAAHGIPIESVHFHEVGAVDSIVDVVVFCDLLEDLSIQRIVAGPIPVGEGLLQIAHGEVSLPTPALLGLANNWTLNATGRPGEQTTPTGAALVTTLAEEGRLVNMKPIATGHGAGTRNPKSHANMTRVVIGESQEASEGFETICVLECQVDDMLPEFLPEALQILLENHALDAYSAPILMKKGRPGFAITVIAHLEHRESLTALLFQHTTTLGVRFALQNREVLHRQFVKAETPWGPVQVKVAQRHGTTVNVAPEFEDCKALAHQHGVPIKQVYASAIAAAERGED